METNNDKDYLKELAPRLFSKEMDEKREIPEGYFDALEDRVMSKIKQEEVVEPEGKVRRLINYRNLSVAAGLALLMALIPFLKDSTLDQTNAGEFELESISEDAAQLYLAEEYDLESIVYDLDQEDITLSEEEELSEEEILNYLIDSEISESLIYESL
ncbi:MAG TPA: hypothetical protein VJ894_04085 [Cryomorphaceae bacterium]|nr:hypothetical protein [Cryomorphaceae bacterium]